MGIQQPYRVGKWLASDQKILDEWLANVVAQHAAATEKKPLHPLLAEFKSVIEDDPSLYMLFHQMFEEIPEKKKYLEDPMGNKQVRDYQHLLELMNLIMTTAPEYGPSGLVGFPINALVDWPMGTSAGFAAFLNPKVNAQLKKILNAWGVFLQSADSTSVLNDDRKTGWFGAEAKKAMPKFEQEFICDPSKPYYGYTSWDDFFTRRFKPGVRPVDEPDNDNAIANACESAPYNIERDVNTLKPFWIKGHPYSLNHMLANHDLTQQFIGGTVYQAFLSALSYHRWHSPVNGKIVKTEVIDGTYYSESPAFYFDDSGPNLSQGYITEVATRGLIFIEADNPKIGLMAVMPVGMSEVSTCDITVYPGQQVKKGDELGMFHFGGSTHCLIFRPGVELEFVLGDQEPGLHSKNIPVRSTIARVI